MTKKKLISTQEIAQRIAVKYVEAEQMIADLKRLVKSSERANEMQVVIDDYNKGILKEEVRMDTLLATLSNLFVDNEIWFKALDDERQKLEMEELRKEAEAYSGY